MKSFIIFSLLFLVACVTPAQSAILVMSPNGTYTTKLTLSDAATAPDTAGKTVVVTSALSAVQSNISSATVHCWPGDRDLKIKKGGSINNTTRFLYCDSTGVAIGDWRGPRNQTVAINQAPATRAAFDFTIDRKILKTQSGIDVQSGSALEVQTQSYSTNTINNNDKTSQVGIVANASAMDTQSSASVVAINAISTSAYTGAINQTVNPIQSNIVVTNPPGFFGDASKSHGIAISGLNLGTQDATMGLQIDTGPGGGGFLHGGVISGAKNTGLTIARSGITPHMGLWVSAATDYGLFVGARAAYPLEPGQIPTYDANHNPSVGVGLGERGATSALSNSLQFTSADGSSVLHNAAIFTDANRDINITYDTAPMWILTHIGTLYSNGNPVVGPRNTGWTAPFAGTPSKVALDPSTATVVQLTNVVNALMQALITHGLIGP